MGLQALLSASHLMSLLLAFLLELFIEALDLHVPPALRLFLNFHSWHDSLPWLPSCQLLETWYINMFLPVR